ncbi:MULTISPECIES: hypothetical protein [unclassified Burkholderia]|uniref:hypothetical protein n=1 Tax=unclassified Burkholderia TaxID=2613784 RepID=UPI0012E3F3E8|nr:MULTISPECIES: hypothetical protein [unclassified Burkholderia]
MPVIRTIARTPEERAHFSADNEWFSSRIRPAWRNRLNEVFATALFRSPYARRRVIAESRNVLHAETFRHIVPASLSWIRGARAAIHTPKKRFSFTNAPHDGARPSRTLALDRPAPGRFGAPPPRRRSSYSYVCLRSTCATHARRTCPPPSRRSCREIAEILDARIPARAKANARREETFRSAAPPASAAHAYSSLLRLQRSLVWFRTSEMRFRDENEIALTTSPVRFIGRSNSPAIFVATSRE